MANKTYAIEWLQKAYHDLDSANILFVSGHYTDTIGYLYHQSIEKIYKSIIAFANEPIEKTHNLIELNELTGEYFDLNEDELIALGIITTYHTKQRYPTMDKKLPTKEEINKAKDLAIFLFDKVCSQLNINKSEITNEI
ncbi:MAG: HEPN domain-containing protein [Arcobacteraceae bacterium]|jgi:HEPN domain-containing protein|nr:HEPN domain-containing protein [Arcobacteraceae bacterium]